MCGFWQSVTRGTWGPDREGEGGDRLCWRDAVSLQLRSNCNHSQSGMSACHRLLMLKWDDYWSVSTAEYRL